MELEITGSDDISKSKAIELYKQGFQEAVQKFPSLEELEERARKQREVEEANQALIIFTLTNGFSRFCVEQILYEFKIRGVKYHDRFDPVLAPLFDYHDRFLSGRFPAPYADLVEIRNTEQQVFEACSDKFEARRRGGPLNPVSDLAWADSLYGTTPAPVSKDEVMDKLVTVEETSLDEDFRN